MFTVNPNGIIANELLTKKRKICLQHTNPEN